MHKSALRCYKIGVINISMDVKQIHNIKNKYTRALFTHYMTEFTIVIVIEVCEIKYVCVIIYIIY